MNKEQADLIREARKELRRRASRVSLAPFIMQTFPEYEMGWVHEEICAKLDQFLADVIEKKSPRLIISMPPRSGKLCADETPVLTDRGFLLHGDLKVGDTVYHPSGRPIKVLAVGAKDYATHRVYFSNGDAIDTHLDHEWFIHSRLCMGYKTVETRFFTDHKLDIGTPNKRGHRYFYQIDRANAPLLPKVDHDLPPYVLGIWLGDGVSSKPHITMSKDDTSVIIPEFERLGVPVGGQWVHKETGVITFTLANGISSKRTKSSQALKDLNVLNNKHIPTSYLYDSLENRLELLAGLMDSDGSLDKAHNRYVFSNVNKQLAEDVKLLANLCGFGARIVSETPRDRNRSIKDCAEIYLVSFYPSGLVPCRLARKQNALLKQRKNKRIAIIKVEQLEQPKIGNCIQVESEDGLYLVGKNLTTTHNSEIVSRRFPAYVFGRYPDLNIISASYSADLSTRMNRDVQRIIDNDRYGEIFPDTSLAKKGMSETFIRNADMFEIVGHKGSYRSAGVGGGLTGMGCEILCIDDPVKDRASADSVAMRDNVYDWYTSTAYTRLSRGGGVIVMCTRWHMDDLVGRLLDDQMAGGDQWQLINYPAIAEQDEPHRKQGEALHPERYPLTQLESIKNAIGQRDWAALYQQHPIPEGGAIFKPEWLKEYTAAELPPQFETIVASWDMSFKDSDGADFCVGQIWGRKGASYYLIDQVRGRWDFVKTREMFVQLVNKHPKATKKLIEEKANGSAIISELKLNVSGIVPIVPKESKTARAYAITPFFEAGNVFIPCEQLAPWVREYKAELLQFPSGAHDDQVDATTQALNYFREHIGGYIHPDNIAMLRIQRR